MGKNGVTVAATRTGIWLYRGTTVGAYIYSCYTAILCLDMFKNLLSPSLPLEQAYGSIEEHP